MIILGQSVSIQKKFKLLHYLLVKFNACCDFLFNVATNTEISQFLHGTVDSRYYELACYEVPVITRFFAGPEPPRACFNALKYGLYEQGSCENTVITR